MGWTGRAPARQIEEIEDPISLLNERVLPSNVSSICPIIGERSLRAVLVAALTHTQALLTRLEARRGVQVSECGQDVVRELFLATRAQRDALAATLEIDGLE